MGEDKASLAAAIRELAKQWHKKLTSLDRRNPTLYFKALKVGTLRLPDLGTEHITALVDGNATVDLTKTTTWTEDSEKRLTAIRAKAKENEEERGIQTLFVALGLATWKSADGGSNPRAPIFLLPVTVAQPSGRTTITRAGDLMLNHVMLQAWEQEHKHKPAVFESDDLAEMSIRDALSQVADAGKGLDGFQISQECYIGNFSFAKMAMVEDLRKNEALLLQNRLISAIAGDAESQNSIKADAGTVEREELDSIDPFNETGILEADEYQRQAIHSLTRFNADGVIDGPPGTGKSQTIANLIAALVADGKRVLFVAEKRAALDAVLNRLTEAGLEDIVLDLHGGDTRRKTIYDRLRHRDERARYAEDRPSTGSVRNLKALRTKLNAYYRAVNTSMVGCDLNVRDLISRLSKLSVQSETVWYEDLDLMTMSQHESAKEHIHVLARHHALFRRDAGVAWSQADFDTPQQAADALRLVAEARTNINKLRDLLAKLQAYFGRDVITFADLGWAAKNISIVRMCRDQFSDEVVQLHPGEVASHLAPAASGGVSHVWAMLTNGPYRSAVRALRSSSKDKKASVATLAECFGQFNGLPDGLRCREAFEVVTPDYADGVSGLWNKVKNVRASVADSCHTKLDDDVDTALAQLADLEKNHRFARQIPEVRGAERKLADGPYADLRDELKQTSVPPSSWDELADHAYFRSFLEKAKTDEPLLGGFQRESFEKMRAEFQDVDSKQLARSRVAVRRRSAEAYVNTKNTHKDQAIIFRAELQKKARNMPIRKLMERSGDIIVALCPCFMASPLSVSQLLPGDRALFDVVIFDEASQVVPEDAIPSIMRAKRTVVAGDQKQLPPTTFFASGSADVEDDEEVGNEDPELVKVSLEGMESILDVMVTFANRQPLNVHYRSLDESLIRFSNHEFYYDRLVTFPSAHKGDVGINHVLVESPGNDGEELSSSAEISRVMELIFEHAEKRPDETLGVISLGLKHARRIEAALAQERKKRPDLDEFFARDGVNESFFVKNLERVQGDERDAIILSFGYAKDGAGNLKNKLGPVNYSGGERRLNVAVTRAKTRMTVVSSFTENDMDRTRFGSNGAQILSRYLAYARSSGTKLDDVQETEVEMNEFERDVMDTLTSKGLKLVPQLGVSKYRLDFAVLHPKIPNKFVLAIECDGAPYHSSATARDRDRLRQTHLERRGWTFHRIWSLDWHEERAAEIDRVLKSYAAAIASSNGVVQPATPSSNGKAHYEEPVTVGSKERGKRPRLRAVSTISDYTEAEIQRVITWICSDGILRSDEEIIAEAIPVLGFARRGRLIDERLSQSVVSWRNRA